jgi:hypothetical protein
MWQADDLKLCIGQDLNQVGGVSQKNISRVVDSCNLKCLLQCKPRIVRLHMNQQNDATFTAIFFKMIYFVDLFCDFINYNTKILFFLIY